MSILKQVRVVSLVTLVGLLASGSQATEIGDTVGELHFKDIRFLPRTVADFGEQKAYVFMFTNTSCPLVQRYMPVLKKLDESYGPQGVQFVAVNVGVDDSILDMAAHAIEFDALFPFVKDIDGNVTRALGVQRTPEVAVLDADMKLVYRGRIDSQYRLGGVSPNPGRADLEEAIKDVLAGNAVSVAETAVDGCKITHPKLPKPAEPITYTKHVAHIMKQHCQTCHREDTAAPFGLGTYEEVSAQGEMVAEVVTEQRMPPWYAHRDHVGKFKNNRSLSRNERIQVAQWVAAGMPEGDPQDLPEPFAAPETEWEIGKPDLVITTSKASKIPADGYVPYEYAVLPFIFLNETWVEAFEIKPHNPDVVHHCNMAYASMGAKSGYETFITGYVPGGQAMDLARIEPGVAFRIPARSVLGLQIHHVTTGKEETSQISVGLRYAKSTVRKQSRFVILDTKMHIEPYHSAWTVKDTKTIEQDATILGMFCHMHLRGKDMTFFAHQPDGKTRKLLQIPNYNFDWQIGYELTPGDVRVPGGTKIEAIAHYDNSAFNPYNPDPTRVVPYGQQTYDEMMNGFLFFTYDDEDLNIPVDPKTGRPINKTASHAAGAPVLVNN